MLFLNTPLRLATMMVFLLLSFLYDSASAGPGLPNKPTSPPTTRDGTHNLTLITALFNINRDNWPNYPRNQTKYRGDMQNVLRLKQPMVIFTDSNNAEFIRQSRREAGLDHLTLVNEMRFEDLPMHRHRAHIEQIQFKELNETGGWLPEWEEDMKTRPEVFSPDYDVLVNSKPHFLYSTARSNPFGTEFFAWIDAGFGHLAPEQWRRPGAYDWQPKFPAGKMTMLKRTTRADKVTRYRLADLYHRDIPEVLNAGLIGGDRAPIEKFYRLFYEELQALLDKDMIEDEQVVFVLVAAKHPELFNVVDRDCGPDLMAARDGCVKQADAFTLLRRARSIVVDAVRGFFSR